MGFNFIFARKALGLSMGVLWCLQGLTYISFVCTYYNEIKFNELNKIKNRSINHSCHYNNGNRKCRQLNKYMFLKS